MHQSVRLAPSPPPPPPPPSPSYCGTFSRLVSPGGGALVNFARGPGICQPRGHSRGDLQLMEIRERVPLPWARVARSLAAKVPSREGGVHWNALLSYKKVHSDLYFVFLQKALVWEITEQSSVNQQLTQLMKYQSGSHGWQGSDMIRTGKLPMICPILG